MEAGRDTCNDTGQKRHLGSCVARDDLGMEVSAGFPGRVQRVEARCQTLGGFRQARPQSICFIFLRFESGRQLLDLLDTGLLSVSYSSSCQVLRKSSTTVYLGSESAWLYLFRCMPKPRWVLHLFLCMGLGLS